MVMGRTFRTFPFHIDPEAENFEAGGGYDAWNAAGIFDPMTGKPVEEVIEELLEEEGVTSTLKDEEVES